jgi:hypothetical protein
MSRPTELPSEARVRKELDDLLLRCDERGTAPSVLALARLFAMSNTTFRRHFPDIARRVSDARRSPPTEPAGRAKPAATTLSSPGRPSSVAPTATSPTT